MPALSFDPSRRRFVAAAALAPLFAAGALADDLARTPKQTEGPFYPSKLPLDTDNDLIVVNDALNPAAGIVTHLTGKVLDKDGTPVRGACVEIWQCDANGVYLHPLGGIAGKRDANFQGFGRFAVSSSGEYYFRTIYPVAYVGRTPHIHVKVKRGGKELLTTQCYIKGHKANDRDGVLRGLKSAEEKARVMVDFQPVAGSKTGEKQGEFVIVLGKTPEAD